MKRQFCLLAIVTILCSIGTGCNPFRKPYNETQYSYVSTFQTAFLIPLEDKSEKQKQVQMDNIQNIDKLDKITAGRFMIPRRWNKTGYGWRTGNYKNTLQKIIVDRTPITRLWTADANSGTSKKNEAIWLESKNSISFSVPFNCTARITQEDSSTYLYWYPSNSLTHVIDTEIHNMVQKIASEFCAKYDLDELRSRKVMWIEKDGVKQNGLNETVREEVTNWYKNRGITISTLGLAGEFTYRNKQVQDKIDQVFIDQQERLIEAAKLKAVPIREKRLEAEGQAIALKTEALAQGDADAVKLEKEAKAGAELMLAEARAYRIKEINKATTKASKNPVFLRMMGLEVEQKRIDRWDGQVPRIFLGGKTQPKFLFTQPTP